MTNYIDDEEWVAGIEKQVREYHDDLSDVLTLIRDLVVAVAEQRREVVGDLSRILGILSAWGVVFVWQSDLPDDRKDKLIAEWKEREKGLSKEIIDLWVSMIYDKDKERG